MSEIKQAHSLLLDRYGTDENPHAKGSLREHLIGTHRLLNEWGNPPHVSLAGLFHSIYGTQHYKVSSTSLRSRENIAAGIGEKAEQLAYLFCVTDRIGLFFEVDKSEPRLWDFVKSELVSVSPDVIQELVEIEIANYVEQQVPATPLAAHHISHYKQMLTRGGEYITSGARRAFEQMLHETPVAG